MTKLRVLHQSQGEQGDRRNMIVSLSNWGRWEGRRNGILNLINPCKTKQAAALCETVCQYHWLRISPKLADPVGALDTR